MHRYPDAVDWDPDYDFSNLPDFVDIPDVEMRRAFHLLNAIDASTDMARGPVLTRLDGFLVLTQYFNNLAKWRRERSGVSSQHLMFSIEARDAAMEEIYRIFCQCKAWLDSFAGTAALLEGTSGMADLSLSSE